jgi:inner membrane protein
MDAQEWGLVWLITAAIFLGGELVLPGFILLPFGISAALAAVLGFAGVSPAIGWVVFILGGALGFVIFWKYARRSLSDIPMPLGVGTNRMVGMRGTLIGDIPGGATGRGFVILGSEEWRAEAADHRPIAKGVEVEVVEVKGTVVRVRTVGSIEGAF